MTGATRSFRRRNLREQLARASLHDGLYGIYKPYCKLYESNRSEQLRSQSDAEGVAEVRIQQDEDGRKIAAYGDYQVEESAGTSRNLLLSL